MALVLNTAPLVEPISLAELKLHLRIDSETLAENMGASISIAPGSHDVAASYGLEGSSVEVSGYDVLVYLVSGDCSAGTVDVKLQQSEDGTTWSDVAGGAFTQVTGANDNAVQEKAYTGAYRYLRAVATVGTAACSFGVVVVRKSGPTTEDDELNIIIGAARRHAETVLAWRTFITTTWELWLDRWPDEDYIELAMPPLQSVESVKYYGTDDAEATFSSDDYFVDTKSEPGRVSLNYGKTWPSTTLRPHNGICITFVAGYGDAGSDVPKQFRMGLLLLAGHWYEHREEVITGTVPVTIPMGARALLGGEKMR